MNSVNLIGRLVKDPELRYISGTDSVYCRFTLAVDKGLSKDKKQELEAKGQQTADFINIVVWGKQAENCQKYLQKGKNAAIQGRLQSGSYTAQDGIRRFVTEVWAERVQFIDWGDSKEKAVDPFDNFDLGFEEAKDEEIPF
ncbi:single-stranded DNA-binding protein [Parvimonas micra]|uniref:single-stranded DNA-binding protein n=1 Tax=Parvimonas micra TaxID=33033 RepID=UPI000E4BD6B1|nr:single-stranded DNA-binding protein [Parvimonas micra]AXU11147.1 single-stranded DNA-binding protein [Parvimonas micra]